MNHILEVERKARYVIRVWRLGAPEGDADCVRPQAVASYLARLAMALAELEQSIQALDAARRAGDEGARFYRPAE